MWCWDTDTYGYGTLLTSWTKSRPSDVKAANVTFLNKPSPLSQQRPLGLVVGVTEKSLSPLITANNDVIEQPWSKKSRPTRHDRCL